MIMKSIGIRLTVFQILVTGIGVVAILYIAQSLFVADIQAEQDRGTREIAEILVDHELPDRMDGKSLAAEIEQRKRASTFPRDFPWHFISSGDSILYSSDARPAASKVFDSINRALRSEAQVDSTFHDVTVAGELYRCYRVPIDRNLFLTVIYSWDDLSGPAARAELVGALLLIILLVTIALGNLFLTRMLLKPVDKMISAMESIINDDVRPTEYGELLPVPAETGTSVNEIESLQNKFVQLLSRLRETATAEYRFIADVAHDIADPLTVLRSDSERDTATRNDPEKRDLFERTIRQLDDIQRLSSDLMLLAHFGLSAGHLSFVSVPMSDVILDEAAGVMPRASQRQVAIVTDLQETEVYCLADPDMVRRLIRRVLHDVLAESSFGSTVRVSLSSESGFALVTIACVDETQKDSMLHGATESALPSAGSQPARRNERTHGRAITGEVVRLQGGSVDFAARDNFGIAVTLRFPLYSAM